MEHDPHEPNQRVEEYAKNSQEEKFFLSLNEALKTAQIEFPPVDREMLKVPIIYVIGTPRSGTTLLYQILCKYLHVGYINNLIARFWLRPSVGIRLSETILGPDSRHLVELKSSYGTTAGIAGPHEFGYFWRYWLKLDESPTHHLSKRALAKVDAQGLKHALENEILGSFRRAVVFKNIICGFHASFLTELHPDSLFVNITRDTLATTRSILNARKKRFGSYKAWWSLKPATYPFNIFPDNPAAEVVKQVFDCRREVEIELSKPGVNAINITYEQLCTETEQVLARILKIVNMTHHGEIVLASTDFPNLRISPAPALPQKIEQRLKQSILKQRKGIASAI